MSARCSLTRILHLLGRGFLVPTRTFTSLTRTKLPLGAMRLKVHWRMHKNSSRTRPKRSSPWVIINTGRYVIMELPKPRSIASVKCYQTAAAKYLEALGQITRREGHWDESIAYFEQALALDPRNVELLTAAAGTYSMVRQFPAARKLYDRVLDIVPNDPDSMADKAAMYQAEGNLQEAAKLLANVNAETPSVAAFGTKIILLRLERNLSEAVRLQQTRQAQFHFHSESERVLFSSFWL